MDTFLKRTSNLLFAFVAGLGLLLAFKEELGIDLIGLLLTAAAILLFICFIALIFNHISKLEEKMGGIEDKFIKAEEYKNLKADIEALKLVYKNKK